MILLSVIAIDRDARWYCTVESIAIRDEMLVIHCRRCILKRKREIPLSAIKDVEYYADYSRWRPENVILVLFQYRLQVRPVPIRSRTSRLG